MAPAVEMLVHLLLLLVAAAQAQPAAPPRDDASPKSGSASLSGRIAEQDSNRPLHRAIVTLVASAGGRQVEALTDAAGRYEFNDLEPGDYGVVAGPGDLRATHLRQAFGREGPFDPMGGLPRSGVELTTDERRSGVDIALARGLAIEGRVLDQSDQPMAHVQVAVTRADGTPSPGADVYSDDRGDYRAFGLAPGRYHVCADPQRYSDVTSVASRFVHTCHPSTLSAADAGDIVLTTAEATGIDIRVQRGGTVTVSGSVLDASGMIVDAPDVAAFPLDPQGSSGYVRGISGRFALRGLTPGRYLISASAGGPGEPYDRRPAGREREVGYASIEILGMDLSDYVISLSKGQRVSGRIAFEGGPPVPSSQLRMSVHGSETGPLWARAVSRSPVSAVTDSLTFELTDLYQLPLTISVTGLPEGWVVKSVRYDAQDITGVPTNFGSAKPGYLDILATSRVATPSVRVTDGRGDPVPSFHVVLFPTNPSRWGWGSLPAWMWMQSPPSRDGVVKLGATLPGEYFVAALTSADNHVLLNDLTRLQDLASVAGRVTLTERDDRTVDLKMTPLPAARR